MKADLKKKIEIPNGVNVELVGSNLKVKGPKGEIERNFLHPKMKVIIEGKLVVLSCDKASKKEKTILGSYTAHLKNIISGVQNPHVYKLKICSGHFPMNVAVAGNELIIKNFFGEVVPRKVDLVKGAEVKVNGNDITVTSPDKEIAGLMAAKIENLCRITKRDIRIFQDGCYITHKSGKSVI